MKLNLPVQRNKFWEAYTPSPVTGYFNLFVKCSCLKARGKPSLGIYKFIYTGPRPAFGRLGVGGSSAGYTGGYLYALFCDFGVTVGPE